MFGFYCSSKDKMTKVPEHICHTVKTFCGGNKIKLRSLHTNKITVQGKIIFNDKSGISIFCDCIKLYGFQVSLISTYNIQSTAAAAPHPPMSGSPPPWLGAVGHQKCRASSALLQCFFGASSVLLQFFFSAFLVLLQSFFIVSSVLLQCFVSASSVLLQ